MIDGRIEGWFTVPAGVTASVTNNGGTTAVAIAAGAYSGLTAFLTYLLSALTAQRPVTAGSWTVSLSTGPNGTGKVTIAVTAGTYSITFTDTNLRDLLGFSGNIGTTSTQIGTKQARGLWIPDCPLAADIDPIQAPLETDRRSTVSPTGKVLTRVGCGMYAHSNLEWSLVSKPRMWISEETTTNASYERFHGDVMIGNGHPWFSPDGKVTIWEQRGLSVGSAQSVPGWTPIQLPALSKLRMSHGRFAGLYRVQWPRLIAEASI